MYIIYYIICIHIIYILYIYIDFRIFYVYIYIYTHMYVLASVIWWSTTESPFRSKVENITHLDLRGNRLNAAFGWKLIKAPRMLGPCLPGHVYQAMFSTRPCLTYPLVNMSALWFKNGWYMVIFSAQTITKNGHIATVTMEAGRTVCSLPGCLKLSFGESNAGERYMQRLSIFCWVMASDSWWFTENHRNQATWRIMLWCVFCGASCLATSKNRFWQRKMRHRFLGCSKSCTNWSPVDCFSSLLMASQPSTGDSDLAHPQYLSEFSI